MRESLPFHSAYLTALSHYQVRGRVRRILSRVLALLVLAGLLLLLLAMVGGRWLPRTGPGWLLYWLHDNLWLPIKGYTYTLFFPTSVVWWLMIALLIGLCLFSLLLDRSFLRGPHTWLLRRAVHWPCSNTWLLTAANLWRRAGVQPDLLHSVVRHELETALLMAAAQPAGQTSRQLCHWIEELTLFEIRLRALPSAPPVTAGHLAAARVWHAAFLPLDLRRRRDIANGRLTSAGDSSAALNLTVALPHLFGWPACSPADPVLSQERPFAPQRLLLDLWRVATLANPTLLGTIPATTFPPALASETAFSIQALQLSCQDRVQSLQRWAKAMRQTSYRLPALTRQNNEAVVELEALDGTVLSACGELALSLAIHASWLTQTPELALATLDAMEIAALDAELQPDSPLSAQVLAALQNLPLPYAYSLTAQLVRIDTEIRWQDWQPLAEAPDSPLQAADHQRALDQADALHQAAGPGFWSPALQKERS